LKALGKLARPQPPEQDLARDRRDAREDWKEQVLRDRFWSLHETTMSALESLAEGEPHWCWRCDPPDDLPEREYPARDGSADVVVDTNVLVDILDAQPTDAPLGVSLHLSRLEPPVRGRISPMLSDGSGKLIVPASVLIETEGVLVAKAARYRQAAAVLDDIAFRPHHPHYAALVFESSTDESFAAFLHLIERLVRDDVHRDSWPRLGDALVLAHGLLHGCAVASNEWIHKDEWSRTQLEGAFPYLVLR
jgi:hypothetical protein